MSEIKKMNSSLLTPKNDLKSLRSNSLMMVNHCVLNENVLAELHFL